MDSIVTTEDTIAAIASAISIGKGGVAIIRVSGKDAINSCKKIVQTKSKYACIFRFSLNNLFARIYCVFP